MHPFKKFVLGTAIVGLVAVVGACGDDDDTSPCETTSVTVTPATATVAAGETEQLSASATDASGSDCGTVTWASEDDAIATVNSSGLVTGVAAGEVDINATAGGVTGTATITVTVDAPPQITMTAPSGGAAVQPGGTVQIGWTATDDNEVTGVDLRYTADGDVQGVIATDVQGATYDWVTPNETLYGVIITGTAKDASGQTASDETTDMFAVVQFSVRGYVTSSVCQDCHPSAYADLFESSGHPYKLNKVVGGVAPTYPNGQPELPTPAGTTWDDFTYVIGGYGWKARWIQNDGYIYTPAAGLNQWNMLPMTFTNYHEGELKPYDCGSCHTTGWQSFDDNGGVNQDGLEGILGTWEEPGITCEQCHGPGVDHVSSGAAHTVDPTTDEFCGSCHNRGGVNADIPVSGEFIRHHEQYNEFANSAHFGGVGCNDCHDPHLGTRYDNGGFILSCVTCHPDQAANNAHAVPIEGDNGSDAACITCHMPQAGKSAVADATNPIFVGDVKTHIFTINPGEFNKEYFFNADSTLVATATEGVTLDFVCYQCHTDPVTGTGGGSSDKSLADLSAKATGIHTP